VGGNLSTGFRELFIKYDSYTHIETKTMFPFHAGKISRNDGYKCRNQNTQILKATGKIIVIDILISQV
jgi:hypothetical protein